MNRQQRRDGGAPTRAEASRIADQIETAGCPRCGIRFGAGMPYLIGKTRAGWTGRCMSPECATDFLPDGPLYIGAGIFPTDPWTEADRDWFRANPRRQWRLRWPLPGEIETLAVDDKLSEQAGVRHASTDARDATRHLAQAGRIAVAVYQFEPGKRLRIPFAFTSADPPDSFTDAAVAVFLPALVKIAETHRAALASDAALERDAQLRRRLEAVANITRGVLHEQEPTP